MKVDAREEVWLNRSNTIEWVVVQDDTPVSSLATVTRAVITVGNDVVDSDTVGSSVIWWTDSVTDKELDDGSTYSGDVVKARLGYVSALDVGEYDDCRLIIYDTSNVSGLVVSDNISITVHAAKY
jgi:hypothetical protein